MYDVIVIGARCAGSPTAMLLADRVTFTSDTLSTHLVQIKGGAALERWGLMDAVPGSNGPLPTFFSPFNIAQILAG